MGLAYCYRCLKRIDNCECEDGDLQPHFFDPDYVRGYRKGYEDAQNGLSNQEEPAE